jgi:hypothetical protein
MIMTNRSPVWIFTPPNLIDPPQIQSAPDSGEDHGSPRTSALEDQAARMLQIKNAEL